MVGLLIIIFGCFTFISHFCLHKMISDDSNQFLVLGTFLFYCGTIVYGMVRKDVSPDSLIFIKDIMVSGAIVCAICYVKLIFQDEIFDRYMLFSFIGIFVVTLFTMMYSFINPSLAHNIYLKSISVVSFATLIIEVIFLIIKWKDFSSWKHILLCSMFFACLCFSLIEVFLLINIQASYYMSIGIIVYLFIYELYAFRKVLQNQKPIHDEQYQYNGQKKSDESKIDEKINEDKHSKTNKSKEETSTHSTGEKVAQNNIKEHKKDRKYIYSQIPIEIVHPKLYQKYGLTRTEILILGLFFKDMYSSKDIAVSLECKPETIDKHVNHVMKKTNTTSRKNILPFLQEETENMNKTS